MVDVLGAVLGVTGVFFKAVEVSTKVATVNDDRTAASHLLNIITDSADDLRDLYKQHAAILDRPTKSKIEREISRADELLEAYRKALNREVIEDEVLDLVVKLAWVFRDKDRVFTYYTMMNQISHILENLSSEVRTAVRVARSSQETTIVDSSVQDHEVELPPRIVLSEDEFYTKDGSNFSIARELDDTPCTIDFELSITADLKKRFHARALKLRGSNLMKRVKVGENMVSDSELYSSLSIKEDLRRRYRERASKFGEHLVGASDISMSFITQS
ncbi:hypothetical protein EDC01DRAFT_651539 [Geopyxis carbonaria]|nr:hypothetical protein EDC01DRAFT_651539 [Geopyxis carbonaria]